MLRKGGGGVSASSIVFLLSVLNRLIGCTTYVAYTHLSSSTTLFLSPSSVLATLIGLCGAFLFARIAPPLHDVCALFAARGLATIVVVPQEAFLQSSMIDAPLVVLLYFSIIGAIGCMMHHMAGRADEEGVLADIFDQYLSFFATQNALRCFYTMQYALGVTSLVYLSLPERLVPSASRLDPASWMHHFAGCAECLMARGAAFMWKRCTLGLFSETSSCLVAVLLLSRAMATFPSPTKLRQCYSLLTLLCAQRLQATLRPFMPSPALTVTCLSLLSLLLPCASDILVFTVGLVLTDAFRAWLEAMSLLEALGAYLHVLALLEWARRALGRWQQQTDAMMMVERKKMQSPTGSVAETLVPMLLLNNNNNNNDSAQQLPH